MNETHLTTKGGHVWQPSFIQNEALTDKDEVPVVEQSFLMPITSNPVSVPRTGFRTVMTSSEHGQCKHIIVKDPFKQYY